MSGITDPAEEYFKSGLWGWVTDQWKKLIGDAAGHLQVDVVESGLPTGAATSANQTTMITAMQLIDDLRAALTTVATDSLDVRLDGQTADVEVTQTVAADLTPGIKGWDGSAWRKLPLLWGYSDALWSRINVADAVAGTNDLDHGAVPAGEIWIVTNIAAANLDNSPSVVEHSKALGPATWQVYAAANPAASESCQWSGFAVLKEDDFIRTRFKGCILNDYLWSTVAGYKMKVTG